MSRTDTWMPLYVGDYLADTMALEAREHGAYLLLIMHYWRNGPLPDDDRALSGIARVDRKTWITDTGPIVREFFEPRDGKLHHKRIESERAKAVVVSGKKRAAAMIRHHGKDHDADPGSSSEDGGGGSGGGGDERSEKPIDHGKLRLERMTAARALGRHTPQEWSAMMTFHGGACLLCKSTKDITKDHIQPVYQGGSDAIENLQPLCHGCNASKGSDTTDYRADGWQAQCKSDAYASRVDELCISPSPASHKEPFRNSELRSGPSVPPETYPDVRTEMFRRGLAMLRGLTGLPDVAARRLLGRLDNYAKKDCSKVLRALDAAVDLRPISPVDWLSAAVRAPDVFKQREAAWDASEDLLERIVTGTHTPQFDTDLEATRDESGNYTTH